MTTDSPKPKRQSPETLRVRSISPAFTVNDLQASLAWYRDVVGFVVEEEWKDGDKLMGVSLLAGTARLYISQDDFTKGKDRQKGTGFRLHLGTAQDIDQLAAGVQKRGGSLESGPADMPWGTRAFGLVDPDGFKLTISSEA
jgi:uncharacterized glyoxalase superfamily protein PhnB